MADNEQSLREHLLYLLRGGGAHMSFDDFIGEFPAELCAEEVPGLPYSAWQVLEHMRRAQWDILEFSRDPKHVSPDFPKGYWPSTEDKGSVALWKESTAKFKHDLKEMEHLVLNTSTDLYAPIPHGEGQTVLREALLVADHNAYHLGALVVMARLLKSK
jgi:hypothetical protein